MSEEQINSKLAQVDALIKECEEMAIKEGLDFELSVAYGMGGTFYGKDKPDYYGTNSADAGWVASSHTC